MTQSNQIRRPSRRSRPAALCNCTAPAESMSMSTTPSIISNTIPKVAPIGAAPPYQSDPTSSSPLNRRSVSQSYSFKRSWGGGARNGGVYQSCHISCCSWGRRSAADRRRSTCPGRRSSRSLTGTCPSPSGGRIRRPQLS